MWVVFKQYLATLTFTRPCLAVADCPGCRSSDCDHLWGHNREETVVSCRNIKCAFLALVLCPAKKKTKKKQSGGKIGAWNTDELNESNVMDVLTLTPGTICRLRAACMVLRCALQRPSTGAGVHIYLCWQLHVCSDSSLKLTNRHWDILSLLHEKPRSSFTRAGSNNKHITRPPALPGRYGLLSA